MASVEVSVLSWRSPSHVLVLRKERKGAASANFIRPELEGNRFTTRAQESRTAPVLRQKLQGAACVNFIKPQRKGGRFNFTKRAQESRRMTHPWRAMGEGPADATGSAEDILFSKLPGMESPATFAAVKKISKVLVVGVGNVGMACAQTILTENLADVIALVDVAADKLRGEMLDLQHAAAFLPNVTILADTDYAVTADSDICIVTAGARQREGEDRLSLVGRNVAIFKNIIPALVRHSPDAILLIVSNPVDVLSWAAWKLSGLPPNRVIGSGTTLDSSRFQALIAGFFRVSAHNVHAQIVGEHGETSVALWDSLNVAGVPIAQFLESRHIAPDPAALRELHRRVVDGAAEVIRLKGYTSWAIGYSVAKLVGSLLRDQKIMFPVSVLARGFHGIEGEVYLSLPASLGRAGVLAVVNSMLSDAERAQLQASATSCVCRMSSTSRRLRLHCHARVVLPARAKRALPLLHHLHTYAVVSLQSLSCHCSVLPACAERALPLLHLFTFTLSCHCSASCLCGTSSTSPTPSPRLRCHDTAVPVMSLQFLLLCAKRAPALLHHLHAYAVMSLQSFLLCAKRAPPRMNNLEPRLHCHDGR